MMQLVVADAVVRPLFYCSMYNSDEVNCIDVVGICIVGPLSTLYVAIFRNHFDGDIVAPNSDAPNSVVVVAVAAAVLVGFVAAIALARAVLAANNAALDVDCTTMMIVATMMLMVGPMMMMISPLQTTFDCCENLIEQSENKNKEKNTQMKQSNDIK